MIFQRVFGPEWEIGIVSVPSQSYRPNDWWRQSAGAKAVIDELAALGIVIFGGE
jgi:hypothetical protein